MLINHFGLSGGKDSTALWGWAFNESGYPIESIRGTFCDTENEYEEVYEQIRSLNEYAVARGAVAIQTLRSEGFLNLMIRKKRFPGARSRFCTEVLKILPTLYWLQEQWLDGHEVLLHSGVRGDESTERGLLDEYGVHMQCRVRRPLLKWAISDVWRAHERWQLPINPLYKLGRRRVGCRLCCMSNKADVRTTAKTRPWVIDLYRQWEQIVGASSNGGYASFFPRRTVPEQFRSVKGLVRQRDKRDGKKGELYSICTIDDVVRWSMTLHGGKEEGFGFMYEENAKEYEMDDAHAPCKSGYCE